MLKKFSAVLLLIISICIIVAGITTLADNHAYYKYIKPSTFYTSHDVNSASFGADFYTYMYKASDAIVSELDDSLYLQNEINKNLIENGNETRKLICSLENKVNYLGGILFIIIGLILFCFSLNNISNTFVKNISPKSLDISSEFGTEEQESNENDESEPIPEEAQQVPTQENSEDALQSSSEESFDSN